MAHVLEPAASGRSKCRGCTAAIDKGEFRFGERFPNPFADGEMTVWFHLLCAAYRRPGSLCEVLAEVDIPDVKNAASNHRRRSRTSAA
ncbi:MAG: PARP-type zinc finger-containing protein [Pseudomonadales bacterium]|jgi:hypothetical protein|nr:PARP-type zinc finger-containing protein [Pseudomonadales bacterium]MDP6826939.1 PARP-type zinc finger-containing protein [Pseudomonadales bacterium]|tara:strand:- start:6763 stop:7026 length:264 start_codon:yes stop_codon:yes gene_type:complete